MQNKENCPGAKLVVLSGEQEGREIVLSKGRKTSIGRGSNSDIKLTDRGISRTHCYIFYFDNKIILEDADSINGTFVNDHKIIKESLVMDDIIMLGFAKLQLKENVSHKKASADDDTDRQITMVIYRKEKQDPTFALKLKDVKAQWGLLLLHEVGKLVQKYNNIPELSKALLEHILEEFYAERGCVVLKPRPMQNNTLKVFCSRPDNSSVSFTDEPFSPSQSILDAALTKGEGTVSTDTLNDEQVVKDPAKMKIHSIICVPIEGQKGTLGAIYLDSASPNCTFEKQELDLLTAISRQMGLALDRLFLEEQLMVSEQHYRLTCQSIIEHSLDVIYRRHLDHSFLLISPSVEKLLGYGPEEFLEKRKLWENCIYEEDKEYFLAQQEQVFSGKVNTTLSEFRMVHKDGKVIWVGETSHAICNEEGKISCVQGLIKDITQNKESMEQIKEALEEKEVLLKEIHHRVKNNLQIISSLLNLQCEYIEEEQILDMFKDSQNRIKSMALIHEKLYQSKNMACIDFARYIRNLVDHLFQSYRTHPNIRISLDIGEVLLDIDTAIPCGLIINELVSNSLKHAFPNNKGGEIEIKIHLLEENPSLEIPKYKMVVADNGIGFPENKDFRNTESLGFQLVHSLLVKLKGKINLEKDHGTKFNIIFSGLKYKKRI